MNKHSNIKINQNEAERVLNLVNTKLSNKITIQRLLENISISERSPEDYWNVKLKNLDGVEIENSLEISIDHLLNSRVNPY